jgi:hypothetical protein
MLLEAKAQLKHGEWLPWLSENFDLTRRTASTYMRLANGKPISHLDATGRQRRRSRLQGYSLLSDSVKRENLQLALELIQAGFKRLAFDAHPDRGGSTDRMQRLSRARDWAIDTIAHAHIWISTEGRSGV